jgi:predicted solute-binding protein
MLGKVLTSTHLIHKENKFGTGPLETSVRNVLSYFISAGEKMLKGKRCSSLTHSKTSNIYFKVLRNCT